MAKKYAFGVDIEGTTVKIGFFTVKGKLLKSWEIPTDKSEDGAHILPGSGRNWDGNSWADSGGRNGQ